MHSLASLLTPDGKLSTSARSTPLAGREQSLHSKPIVVELCNPRQTRIKDVTALPLGLLELYAPHLAARVDHASNRLRLRIPTIFWPTVDDHEIPALNRVFAHMRRVVLTHAWNSAPAYTSVEAGVSTYRALQLLSLHAAAERLRARLLRALALAPLSAEALQVLWRTFRDSPELPEWLNAVARNVAVFDLVRRGDSLVRHFLEGELGLMTRVQADYVEGAYRVHGDEWRKLGGWGRVGARIRGVVVGEMPVVRMLHWEYVPPFGAHDA